VRFVDTNILLYAISRDPAEEHKALIANEIIDGGGIGLSVQVLQEFYVQATRATREDALTHEAAAGLVEAWCRFPVQVTSVEVMRAALATRGRFGMSYWDAAILEAARALGCSVVLSEDLDDATDYDGVRVEDPFPTAA
jgi:predicted nucleic acid-binding protein